MQREYQEMQTERMSAVEAQNGRPPTPSAEPSRTARFWLGIVIFLSLGLTAWGCATTDERTIEREVELLVGAPGPRADAAEQRLIARGGSAILYLETGLYHTNANGRRRVIKVLVRIGKDPRAAREARPILEHIVATDVDQDVREAARRALMATP